MVDHRCKRPLTISEILRWADVHYAHAGQWPHRSPQSIIGAPDETWDAVDSALRNGNRGLPGGSSLARLLAEHRDMASRKALPPLTEKQVLAWADAYHIHTGSWPTAKSGAIPHSGGEYWSHVDTAMRAGTRGFRRGSSLPRLLAKRRGVRNHKSLPPLNEACILAWCDAAFERTGEWPSRKDGAIPDAPGETWLAVETALTHGQRDLPGGSTLALLQAEHRGLRHPLLLPNWTVEQVLSWADAHRQRTGHWPHIQSGAILEAPGETWSAINHGLRRGTRGLPGGSSLAELLAVEREVRNCRGLPPLSRKQILAWADAHRRRTGDWPQVASGPIAEAPGEAWVNVNAALKKGTRGLPGGSSLARLLAVHRGKRAPHEQPALTYKQLLAWADGHRQRTGQWPNKASGAVQDAPGEQWRRLDDSIRRGNRGLPGGSSLLRLLARKRGVPLPSVLPPLTEEQILCWAEQHRAAVGAWPHAKAGPVRGVEGETWSGVNRALRQGKRGLPGQSSLAALLAPAKAKQT